MSRLQWGTEVASLVPQLRPQLPLHRRKGQCGTCGQQSAPQLLPKVGVLIRGSLAVTTQLLQRKTFY